MRCCYLTFQPAENDENAWSGLNFNIRQTLRQAGFKVEHLGGLTPKCPWSVRIKGWYYRYGVKKGFDPHRDRTFLNKAAQGTMRRIDQNGPFDFIMAPSSYPLTGLRSKIPMFIWVDATFPSLVDYYPDFRGISKETLREGAANEGAALKQCAGAIFSSDWAAESALREYHLNEKKVHVVPFGANMPSPFLETSDAMAAINRRSAPPYEFLFLGVDWPRKGGAFAVQVIQKLNELGVSARLTVAGCAPVLSSEDSRFVKVVGFLDKTKPSQLAQLEDLLLRSHFLILPTQAEAYGLVFAEAASFAVPSLAFHTGGVPTLVQNAETGLLFKPEENPAQWAEKIRDILQNPHDYVQMASAAYERYCKVLNWNVASKRIREIIVESLSGHDHPAT